MTNGADNFDALFEEVAAQRDSAPAAPAKPAPAPAAHAPAAVDEDDMDAL